MIRKTLLAATILLSAIGLFAQSETTTSGGEAKGSGGIVSYTIGQIAYQSQGGSCGTVSQGVQQTYQISTATGIENKAISLVQVSAYPNPATDYLTLQIDNSAQTRPDLSQLSCQLYDMQGKLLQSQKLTNNQTKIDMSALVSSIYFVRVINKNQSIKVFKIIKN